MTHKERRPAHAEPAPTTTDQADTADHSRETLLAAALALREFTTAVVDATAIGTYAVEYAVNGWEVFPLRGKAPAIPKELGGRGVLDATTNIGQVIPWWSGPYRRCNIGIRVPESMFVLDVDG